MPTMYEREELLAWIIEVVEATGWSIQKWADNAGVSGSSLVRMREHLDAPMPGAQTIVRLARAATRRGPVPRTVIEEQTDSDEELRRTVASILGELEKVDAASIRALREHMLGQKGGTQHLKSLDTRADRLRSELHSLLAIEGMGAGKKAPRGPKKTFKGSPKKRKAIKRPAARLTGKIAAKRTTTRRA